MADKETLDRKLKKIMAMKEENPFMTSEIAHKMAKCEEEFDKGDPQDIEKLKKSVSQLSNVTYMPTHERLMGLGYALFNASWIGGDSPDVREFYRQWLGTSNRIKDEVLCDVFYEANKNKIRTDKEFGNFVISYFSTKGKAISKNPKIEECFVESMSELINYDWEHQLSPEGIKEAKEEELDFLDGFISSFHIANTIAHENTIKIPECRQALVRAYLKENKGAFKTYEDLFEFVKAEIKKTEEWHRIIDTGKKIEDKLPSEFKERNVLSKMEEVAKENRIYNRVLFNAVLAERHYIKNNLLVSEDD